MSDTKKYQVTGRLGVHFTVEVEAEDEDTADETVQEMDEGNLCDQADYTDVEIDSVEEVT